MHESLRPILEGKSEGHSRIKANTITSDEYEASVGGNHLLGSIIVGICKVVSNLTTDFCTLSVSPW